MLKQKTKDVYDARSLEGSKGLLAYSVLDKLPDGLRVEKINTGERKNPHTYLKEEKGRFINPKSLPFYGVAHDDPVPMDVFSEDGSHESPTLALGRFAQLYHKERTNDKQFVGYSGLVRLEVTYKGEDKDGAEYFELREVFFDGLNFKTNTSYWRDDTLLKLAAETYMDKWERRSNVSEDNREYTQMEGEDLKNQRKKNKLVPIINLESFFGEGGYDASQDLDKDLEMKLANAA